MKIDKSEASFSNPIIAAYYCTIAAEFFHINLMDEFKPKLSSKDSRYLLEIPDIDVKLDAIRVSACYNDAPGNANNITTSGSARNTLFLGLLRDLCATVLPGYDAPKISWLSEYNNNVLSNYVPGTNTIEIYKNYHWVHSEFTFCSHCASVYQGLRKWEIINRRRIDQNIDNPSLAPTDDWETIYDTFNTSRPLFTWELDPRCGNFSSIFDELTAQEYYPQAQPGSYLKSDIISIAIMIIDMFGYFNIPEMDRAPWGFLRSLITPSNGFDYHFNSRAEKAQACGFEFV